MFQADPRGSAFERLFCLRLYACITEYRKPRPIGREAQKLDFETELFGYENRTWDPEVQKSEVRQALLTALTLFL